MLIVAVVKDLESVLVPKTGAISLDKFKMHLIQFVEPKTLLILYKMPGIQSTTLVLAPLDRVQVDAFLHQLPKRAELAKE